MKGRYQHLEEPNWARRFMIGGTYAIVLLLLVVPLWAVAREAFSEGPKIFWHAVTDPETLKAICLSLLVVAVVIPVNLLFGLALAWLVTMTSFRGKNLLITLIDLPFSVSPVIVGLMFILIFGRQGWFGPWLGEHDIKIIFAVPGIILATLFITSPFIARELIPLMQSRGTDQEEAAVTLGAKGFRVFWHITLPEIRWGLLYGMILMNARALGEFGAVSVVSGHIRGQTVTIPLQVEMLYNEYQFAPAFAVSSLLALLAVLTLILQHILEAKMERKEA